MADTLPTAAGAAVVLFAGTNIDDMVVLTVLNASSRAGGLPKRWQIWAGQYAGLAGVVQVLACERPLFGDELVQAEVGPAYDPPGAG